MRAWLKPRLAGSVACWTHTSTAAARRDVRDLVHTPGTPPPMAPMRLQYPLSEEPFLEKLVEWCGDGSLPHPALHDPPPPNETALLEEERAVYAHGQCVV